MALTVAATAEVNSLEFTKVDRKRAIMNLSHSGYFIVQAMGKGKYSLTRSMAGKPMVIILEETGAIGGFWIKPPSYLFKSKTSFFEYCEDEGRWSRNKEVIKQVVKYLKKSACWEIIENKNFFKVNENTKKNTIKKAEQLINKIL